MCYRHILFKRSSQLILFKPFFAAASLCEAPSFQSEPILRPPLGEGYRRREHFSFHSYSVRNAAIGLIRVARRAGSQVATRVAAPSRSGAVENAIGSSEPTW